jgi:hypothetical protein
MKITAAKPWYREPWPWILLAGPVIVILAGGITAWLAISGADGLVEDDYYKQGLAVNQRKQRDAEATRRGLTAQVRLAKDGASVELEYHSASPFPKPPVLTLHLAHPTRAGRDVELTLPLGSDGLYRGPWAKEVAGRWYVSLDDPSLSWRLFGEWQIVAGSDIKLFAGSDDSPTGGHSHGVGTVVQK